jgi:glycosyltransferase involved in cell wall biosynthesis
LATLKTFSAIGGIEKFNRCFALALQQNAEQAPAVLTVSSIYDSHADEAYLDPRFFEPHGGRKLRGFLRLLRLLPRNDLVFVAHINLAWLALAAKWVAPRTRLVLLAHGVEVWQFRKWWQKRSLRWFHEVWAVSRFTAEQLQGHGLPASRIRLFPNCLDPWFGKAPADPLALRKALHLTDGAPLLLTVARLQSTEAAKGYDQVLACLPALLQRFPHLTYVLAGPVQEEEKGRILNLLHQNHVPGSAVCFTGFLDKEALVTLYRLADVFVMPSSKEGFGIVFLEAAWCGCRIVASDAGGAPEALLQGALGTLVAPGRPEALLTALVQHLEAPPFTDQQQEERRQLVEKNFGFEIFRDRQKRMLDPDADF